MGSSFIVNKENDNVALRFEGPEVAAFLAVDIPHALLGNHHGGEVPVIVIIPERCVPVLLSLEEADVLGGQTAPLLKAANLNFFGTETHCRPRDLFELALARASAAQDERDFVALDLDLDDLLALLWP